MAELDGHAHAIAHFDGNSPAHRYAFSHAGSLEYGQASDLAHRHDTRVDFYGDACTPARARDGPPNALRQRPGRRDV
jgi:hypothetical protein